MYIDPKRIEFVITNACSGKCRHCSNGGSRTESGSIDADAAVSAVNRLADRYQIESLIHSGASRYYTLILYARSMLQPVTSGSRKGN